MKIVLFLVICAVAYTVADPDGTCPEEDPEKDAVYLPDTDNCYAFYECSNGVPNQFFCSPGTYYDEDTNVCATRVKCGDKATTPKGFITPDPITNWEPTTPPIPPPST